MIIARNATFSFSIKTETIYKCEIEIKHKVHLLALLRAFTLSSWSSSVSEVSSSGTKYAKKAYCSNFRHC